MTTAVTRPAQIAMLNEPRSPEEIEAQIVENRKALTPGFFDQQPFFSTQWEREDYERRQRGEPELGPALSSQDRGTI